MAPAYGYEVKEDEEQNKKLLEIIELLVASGYFRARIKGLNSFDKVVGGMIWCISICNFDIDVDLLFQENATIGQKISMTEKIVEVLKEMKCPYHLEPHQIQGLDFIHVFSVIQWLVKKAIESKKGREDYNRSYAVSEFNKIHSFFVDVTKQKKYENALARMVKPQPERKYRRIDGSTLQEENQQIRNTLLEYGRKQYFVEPSSSISSGQEEFKNSEQKVVELFSGLSSASPKQDVVSSDIVGLLVNQKSEEISKIMSSYDDKAKHLKELSSKSQINMKNSAVLLNKQIDILESNLKSSETQREILNADLIKAQKGLKVVLEESASLANQIKECEKECEDEKAVAELERLVTLNDSLKKEESEFKAKCLAKKKKMENLIEQLVLQENVKEEVEKKEEIREELKESLDKLGKLRLILARKNREISALRWKIDDIPSREELHQYQCRFIELHNQVSSKHKETKQFFTLYNSLDDIRLYLDKEVGLLNSVLENFERAMSSEPQKSAFMKQFEQIVEGVKQNKLKVERKQQEVKNNKAQLQEKLAEIVEKQRIYFKTVKDFQEECHKNEIIMKKLQELRQ